MYDGAYRDTDQKAQQSLQKCGRKMSGKALFIKDVSNIIAIPVFWAYMHIYILKMLLACIPAA